MNTHKPTVQSVGAQPTSSLAEECAAELIQPLARQHNIPSFALPLQGDEVIISIYIGLLVHTDGARLWWLVPNARERPAPLWTYAVTVQAAAERLAAHYHELGSRPLAELLPATGREIWRGAAYLARNPRP
ncbi:hypothetical protein ACGFNP_28700 [Nonomuraea sp. NPDC049269]|uniref:hypothetical protein n=1 Tax=Nonomuraea sp. NPDC049269 TaxID=3364349 RepID=UPI0037153F7E